MSEELQPEATGISEEELQQLDALLASPPGKPSFDTDTEMKKVKSKKKGSGAGTVIVVVVSLLLILIAAAAVVYFVVL